MSKKYDAMCDEMRARKMSLVHASLGKSCMAVSGCRGKLVLHFGGQVGEAEAERERE